MSNRRILTIISLLSLVVASVVGVLILSIAFDHNSQGEFYDPETLDIHVGYSAMLFLTWFVPAFVAAWLGILLICGLFLLMARLPGEKYTAIAVLACGLGLILLSAFGLGKDFWSIDACLDRGSVWDYQERICQDD